MLVGVIAEALAAREVMSKWSHDDRGGVSSGGLPDLSPIIWTRC